MVAAIGVSIYEYYGLYVLAICELVLFINYYLTLRRNIPEMLILNEARIKKRIPIIEISDATGNGFWAPMRTEQKTDPLVKSDDSVFVNPKTGLSQTPDRLNGQPIYHFMGNWYFPLSNKNAKAFHDVVNHVRKKHEGLNFLDDLEIMVLLNTDKNDLEGDCYKLMNAHPESNVSAQDLAFELQTVQEELKISPIKPGFFTYNYAFKLIPTATTAADYRQLKQYLERMAQLAAGEGFKKMLQYAIFILIIVVGAALAYTMINK